MRESVHVKVVFRCVRIKGGAEALARSLGVPLAEVQSWMRSDAQIPERLFTQMLDTIIDDTLRKLGKQATNDGGLRG